MKKLFNYLLIILLLAGCSKEAADIDFAEIKENQGYEKINLTENVESFGTDFATFDSKNDFYYFMSKVRNLPIEKLENLTEGLKFVSYEDHLEEIIKGMENIETREEVIDYISNFSEFVELTHLEDGQEVISEIDETEHTVKPFLNKDRIVKIGNEFHKYLGSYCIVSKDYSSLEQIKSEQNVLSSRMNYFIANKKLSEETINISDISTSSERWGDFGVEYLWRKDVNKSWCKNDRRAYFVIHLEADYDQYIYPNGEEAVELTVKAKARLTSLRRGYSCVWYWYNTQMKWYNHEMGIDLKVDGVVSNHSWNLPNDTKPSEYRWKREKTLGTFIGVTTLDGEWTKKNARLYTRGVGWFNAN